MKELFAQIVNNQVVNIIEGNPAGKFQDNLVWVPCTSDTEVGDIYNLIDNSFSKPIKTLEEEKRILLSKVKAIYQAIIAMLTNDFPKDERITWAMQIEECRDYLQDPDSPCIFLRALAKAKQVPLDQLVYRTKALNDRLRQYTGTATGLRQRYEEMIIGCEDSRHLDEIRKRVLEWEAKGVNA